MRLAQFFKGGDSKRITDKKRIGGIGEKIAEEYLVSKGYKIHRRNVNVSHKELDIISEDDTHNVFVEVKTLSVTKEDALLKSRRASDRIDYKKAKNLIYASEYCNKSIANGKPPRIDVIEVYLGDTPPQVVHIENAINRRTLYRKRR